MKTTFQSNTIRLIFISLAFITNIANAQWVKTQTFGSPVGCVYFDNNGDTVYGYTENSKLYKTTDNGLSWDTISIPLDYNMNIRKLVVTDSSISLFQIGGILFQNKYLYISFNGGNSWINYTDSFPTNAKINWIEKYNNRLFLSTEKGLYTSENKGYNWNKLGIIDTNYQNISANGNTLYAVILNDSTYSCTLKKTSDNGLTWTDISNGLPPDKIFDGIISFGSKLYLEVMADSVYVSSDDGSTWKASILNNNLSQQLTFAGTPFYSFNDTLYFHNDDSVFRISNNGTQWHTLQLPYHGRFFIKDSLIFLGTHKGDFKSSDFGNTWIPVNNGFEIKTYIRSFTNNGNDLYVTTFNDGIYKSTNGGQSWNSLCSTYADNFFTTEIAVIDTTLFVGTHHTGVKKSIDNGSTWTYVNNGLTSLTTKTIKSNGTKLFVATNSGLFISDNKGLSWIQTIISDPDIITIVIDGNNIYAKSYCNLFISHDLGTTWNYQDIDCNGEEVSVFNNRIFSGEISYGKYSEDYGMTWDTVNHHTGYNFITTSTLLNPNMMLTSGYAPHGLGNNVTSMAHIFASFDKGQSWNEYTDNLSVYSFGSYMIINDDTLYVAAFTDVWKRPLSDFTGIDNPQKPAININIYPNPINQFTQISYTLEHPQYVTLNIYDLTGRMIKQLVNEIQFGGLHQQTLNASDLQTGIYFCRLTVGESNTSKKLILVR